MWDDISFSSEVIRLNAENNKTGDSKVLPFIGDIPVILQRRLEARVQDCPYVFHRKGQFIRGFRKAWNKAIAQAGCSGRVFHALRRSSIRDNIRAGVHERVAMAISGHKTRSIFDRYNISSKSDIADALRKSHAYKVSQTLSHLVEGDREEKSITISK